METVREGGVTLRVPEQPDAGKGEGVFYNPEQELNRDVTVAALRAYRDREPEAATYLDAMTATGARGVRAANDGWRVTCCDIDPDAVSLTRDNLDRNGLTARVVQRDANIELHDASHDVVDIDPFGTPAPYLDAAARRTRRLLCVTATDTAPLCGAHFKSGVRHYGAVPRNTEYHPEMGARVLLSAIARAAARHDAGATPLLTHATRHYVRAYLEVSRRASDANDTLDALGYLHHCWECLHRDAEPGFPPHPPDACPACGASRVATAGPLWLGPTKSSDFARIARDALDESMNTRDRASRLLDTIAGELDTPTHYDHHRLCKHWGWPAAPLDRVVEALRDAGHEASRTHYSGTAFKTTASLPALRRALEPVHHTDAPED